MMDYRRKFEYYYKMCKSGKIFIKHPSSEGGIICRTLVDFNATEGGVFNNQKGAKL